MTTSLVPGFEQIQRENLWNACEQGDMNTVEQLLNQGVGLDVELEETLYPLHKSCEIGHVGAVGLLLKKNADIHRLDGNGNSPLDIACTHDQVDVAEILLSNGATLGRTPDYYISWVNNGDLMTLLLSHGLDANACAIDDWSLLFMACTCDCAYDVIKALLAAGANTETPDKEGNVPLHVACQDANDKVAQLLLTYGAKVNVVNGDGLSPLLLTCKRDHFVIAKELIDRGAVITGVDEAGRTALHWSCANGNRDLTEILVVGGLDVHQADKNGMTPLHYACSNGHSDVVGVMLGQGAEINQTDKMKQTALHCACAKGYCDIIDLLITHGAIANATDHQHRTPLHYSSMGGHLDATKLLLAKDAKTEQDGDDKGMTPLHHACAAGHLEIVKTLVPKGVTPSPVHRTDNAGMLPLHHACVKGNCDIIEFLITTGGRTMVNSRDNSGLTPLHHSSIPGHELAIDILLENGVDTCLGDNLGRTALHYYCRKAPLLLRSLLRKDASAINQPDHDGGTPLFCAFQQSAGRATVAIQILLMHGADTNNIDKSGIPLLHQASSQGHHQLVGFLGVKMDVNGQDSNGMTPLHHACKQSHPKVVSTLLAKGADIKVIDHAGLSPLQYAYNHPDMDLLERDFEIMEGLLKHGADINHPDNGGRTLLHDIRSAHRTEFLLKHGADIQRCDNNGMTPLHHVRNGMNDVAFIILLEKCKEIGMDVNTVDHLGRTPLHYACQQGYENGVTTLIRCYGARPDIADKQGQTPLDIALKLDNPKITKSIHEEWNPSDSHQTDIPRQTNKTRVDGGSADF